MKCKPGLLGMLVIVALGWLASGHALAQMTFTTIDPPASAGQTNAATGISGNKVVGYYFYVDGPFLKSRGYVYDGSTWTDSNHPAATNNLWDIDGNTVVGDYGNSSQLGYSLTGSTYTTILPPDRFVSHAYGIEGNKVVGQYSHYDPDTDTGSTRGFVYDGSTYTDVRHPDAYEQFGFGTRVTGISGDKMVGVYVLGGGGAIDVGYLYDGVTFTNLFDDDDNSFYPQDIQGDNMVGGRKAYYDHDWITIDHPLAVNGTFLYGIDGDRVVGYYTDASFKSHSFIATIPEPVGLVALMGLAGSLKRPRRSKPAWKGAR